MKEYYFPLSKGIPSPEPTPEENDVNFWDYDGTLVASYTKDDFLALDAMPAHPSHEGLTFYGWNWTLADAQDYVRDYGGQDIGATYDPTDGKTHLILEIDDPLLLSPYLRLQINGTADIDWGDGTPHGTITGTNIGVDAPLQHTYASVGRYDIKIDSASRYRIIAERAIGKDATYVSTANADASHNKCLKEIWISNQADVDQSAYNNSFIRALTLPTHNPNNTRICGGFGNRIGAMDIAIIPSVYIRKQYGLSGQNIKHYSMPKNLNTQNGYGNFDSNFTRLCVPDIMPDNFDSINDSPTITHFVVPKTITSMGAMFRNAYGLQYIAFPKHTSVPELTSTTNCFTNVPDNFEIRVPASLADDWKNETNWCTFADKIVGVY